MDNIPDESGLSPWFLALPWICRKAGALIVAVLMLTLWTLLLLFNVRWWIIILTIITPAIILSRWLWYWTHLTETIPVAGDAGDVAAVRIEFITP